MLVSKSWCVGHRTNPLKWEVSKVSASPPPEQHRRPDNILYRRVNEALREAAGRGDLFFLDVVLDESGHDV